MAESSDIRRKVVAVVTDAYAPFHREILGALTPHLAAADYGVLAVAGRDIRTDRLLEQTATGAAAYQGAFGTRLDVRGAIVVCGATPPTMSDEAIRRYVDELADGPVVSLGIELPHVSSVTIGWDPAIDRLMAHMVEQAAGPRFAFIKGYAGDPHSEWRERGFRRGMAAAGLSVDESLLVRGNFSVADARIAVERLLSSGAEFDAVLAGNDDMAIGAIAALTAHGRRVPEDVVVAGFDDSFAAFASEPPLTSVLLDTALLAEASVGVLLDAIERGDERSDGLVVTLDSDVVMRESSQRLARPAPDPSVSLGIEIRSRLEASRAPASVDVDELVDLAVETMTKGTSAFGDALDGVVTQLAEYGDPVDLAWLRHAQRTLYDIAASTGRAATSPAGLRALVAQLVGVGDRLRPIETRHAVERQAHRELQDRILLRLASCSDRDSLWRELEIGLAALGMQHAWVAANDPEMAVDERSDIMRLVFSLGETLPSAPEWFDAEEVLPHRFAPLLSTDLHVLVPLRVGHTDIGYMVVAPRGEHLLELEAIASAVAQVLRHVRQVEDLQRQADRLSLANEALDRLARSDPLTGLPNRKLLMERLQQDLADVTDEERVSVLFIDLDGFKDINDGMGHGAGDQLLRIIAARLDETVGDGDTLARLGGDEFTIVLRTPLCSDDVERVAREAVAAAATPSLVDGEEVRVSASLGIAHYPDHGTTPAELLRSADAAMYVAKASGRNRYEEFNPSPPMPHAGEERSALNS